MARRHKFSEQTIYNWRRHFPAHYAGDRAALDPWLRNEIVRGEMQRRAFTLTQTRAVEESAAATPGAVTSIFKYVEAEYVKLLAPE